MKIENENFKIENGVITTLHPNIRFFKKSERGRYKIIYVYERPLNVYESVPFKDVNVNDLKAFGLIPKERTKTSNSEERRRFLHDLKPLLAKLQRNGFKCATTDASAKIGSLRVVYKDKTEFAMSKNGYVQIYPNGNSHGGRAPINPRVFKRQHINHEGKVWKLSDIVKFLDESGKPQYDKMAECVIKYAKRNLS